ncbi:MAG: hypothetical protein ABIJ40_03450 [Bacteroidota bacterium]
MTEYERNILDRISQLVMKGKLSNEFLVQNIELAGSFLNLQTISDYAKANNLSYNGVKNHREVRNLFNVKFVVDNY